MKLTWKRRIEEDMVKNLDSRTDHLRAYRNMIADTIDPHQVSVSFMASLTQDFKGTELRLPPIATISRTDRKTMEKNPALKPPDEFNQRGKSKGYKPTLFVQVFEQGGFPEDKDLDNNINLCNQIISNNNK